VSPLSRAHLPNPRGTSIIGTASASAATRVARPGWRAALAFLGIAAVVFAAMAGLGVVGPGVNVIGRYQGPRWLRGWAQAGIVVTLASGAAAAALFLRWPESGCYRGRPGPAC